MALALFDLDNTLLAGDSDYLWGQFLVEQGIVDGPTYEATNQQFYDDYREGKLDIHAFMRFSLRPLVENDPATMRRLRVRFIEEKIEPIITHASRHLIDKHRTAGDTLVIITATNAFITEPIAARLDVPHLLATQPEIIDDLYTGRIQGTPCFQGGKVDNLRSWMDQQQADLKGSWFYSDSINDAPLLELVDHPTVVDPDDMLRTMANERNWPIISLRDD